MPPMSHDLFRPSPTFSDHFRTFPMIFAFSQRLALKFHFATQFGTAWQPQKFYNPCAAHRHIKVARTRHRDCFGPTSAQRFWHTAMGTQSRNRCYEPDMVILEVGLSCVSPVLCASGKIYHLSAFHLKFSHYMYTPLYIPEKQVELHPSSQNLVAAQILTSYSL